MYSEKKDHFQLCNYRCGDILSNAGYAGRSLTSSATCMFGLYADVETQQQGFGMSGRFKFQHFPVKYIDTW